MKNLFASLFFITSFTATAQEHAKPQLLFEPNSWVFERFELPPAFAPSIPYKGAEELRFAPGMFNKDSATYFTYAFVIELHNVTAISQNDIRDYLLKYYKGLCEVTAKDRKLVVDTTQVSVSVEKKKNTPANETTYDASVNIFGVFADGAPVKLNMELKVLINTTAKRTYLVVITSPRERTDAAWKPLYTIQKEFRMPN